MCVFVNQIPLAKAKAKGREGKRESEKKKEKSRQKKKSSSAGHPSWWKCMCAFLILSVPQTLVFAILMMFNFVQMIASLSHRRQYSMWISSSNRSRDIILELLTDWCVLLVVIVCNAFRFLLFSFLYILPSSFSIYTTFDVCMCMYALCKFTRYTRLSYLPPTSSSSCGLLMLATACFCRHHHSFVRLLRCLSHCNVKC